MTIKHVLKDGTALDDISGKIVRTQDAKQVYVLIDKINERGKRVDERLGSIKKS